MRLNSFFLLSPSSFSMPLTGCLGACLVASCPSLCSFLPLLIKGGPLAAYHLTRVDYSKMTRYGISCIASEVFSIWPNNFQAVE
jgi:hypothetical protein